MAAGIGAVGLTTATTAEASWTWTDRDQQVGGPASPPVVAVRTGAHFSYDRLVVDFGGPAAARGWVGYHPGAFWGLGNGRPYLVGGKAWLLIFVQGKSALGLAAGHPMVNADNFRSRGFRSMVDLVFGGSLTDFPWTAFGLGLTQRRVFRLFTLGPDAAGHSRLVLDVRNS